MSVTFVIALLLAPFWLLTFCFAFEVLVGLRPLNLAPATRAQSARVVIIVPAHNEGQILASRLQALKVATGGKFPILLVADNCKDSTARIARHLGVKVIERFDPQRRGKSFAIDFARTHLRIDPPDAVVIVDADCVIDGCSIDWLIAHCSATQRPCQATNLQAADRHASAAVQLSTFAFFIKNVIRQRALQRLAGRVHLLGTGMALPWPIFERAELATGSIVEDLELGQELAAAGYAPLFVEVATVWSNAETKTNTLSQRSRWEGGFLQNALHKGPKMFARSLVKRDARGLWAALNVMIPPFALLILLDLSALVLGATATHFTGAHQWPLLMLGGAIVFVGISLAAAWVSEGSRFITLGGLFRAPLYVIWKLPMYLHFVRRGLPREWVRTRREDP